MIRLPAPVGWVSAMACLLADLDHRVAGELVRRHDQVKRCRPLPDAPRGVIDRPVTRAEPAAVRAAVVAGLLTERDAAKMRAHADDDQPFRFLDARRIRLWIPQG